MTTNLFSPTFFNNLSGRGLLILLTGLLLLFAVAYERNFGAVFPWGQTQAEILLPLMVSATVSGALGYWVVPLLRRLKTGQVIQEDGPQTHLKKAGTPTMGGVFFVPVTVIIALIWSALDPKVAAVSVLTLAYFAIGWLDDWQVLHLKSNKGISPRMKLFLQIAVAVVFCLWMKLTQPESITAVALPGITLPLGVLFWFLAGFVIVAESNATNLTDGVDGLAAGTGAIALLGLGAIVASTSPGLSIFSVCLAGGCLGFLLHNHNPATVFMGDTGSLALGAALAGVGLLGGNLWALLIVSGIFLVESLSVIAQVGYYKATKGPDGQGKRLLKMAPIHHDLELRGWSEIQIVLVFYSIEAGLVLLALMS